MFSRSIIEDSKSTNQRVMPQLGASLIDNSRVVIYDHNMFMIQARGNLSKNVRFLKLGQFSASFS